MNSPISFSYSYACNVSRVVRLPIRVFRPDDQITATATRDLDDAAAAAPTIISPAIDVTLHVNNRRGTARCYRGGEAAAVSYEGFTVASGTVPGFCVPGKRAREMPFLASADGVGLPQRLRDRMAVERRIGAMQLEVEVKLFGRDDGGTAPRHVVRAEDG
uniref:Late embryogenesis abundant protein LEA-2 subgroup domain-containing protein n=1 Tax=Oryza glumipatula TaxID=40148 RepID=A0A0D9YDZ4_9ORYZ